MEEFRNVVGYEDLFMVSNLGRVYSKRTNKILKQVKSKNGYFYLSTKIGGRDGKDVCFKVHRLVAMAFIDNPENKPFINHKDGVKTNNNLDNLEWVTPSENTRHSFLLGLQKNPRGYLNPNSKLTKEDVEYILAVYIPKHKEFGARALGRKFGVSHGSICRVINTGS